MERFGSVLRYLGVAGILVNGIVHLQQYFDGLSDVPKIGPLFAINAVLALLLVIGIALRKDALTSLAGLAFSAGTFAAFLSARYGGILGYQEGIWRNPAIIAAAAEILAIVALAAFLGIAHGRRLVTQEPAEPA